MKRDETVADISQPHWEDLNGRIACRAHVGMAADAYLTAHPDARQFSTELTTWVRMTARDKFDFAKATGVAVVCESCRSEAKRAN